MTSISSTSILQQLLQKDASTSGSSSSSTDQSLTQILAQMQGTNIGDGTPTTGNSYLLDLSPSAQAYLSSLSGNGTTTSQGSTTTSTGASITLSPVQQDKLTAILQKYKDAPYTEATFQKIQQEMSAAGIGADALAAQTQMRGINPTAMLLDALSGGDGSVGTVGNAKDLTTMQTSFMSKVNDQWKAMSSDYDPRTGGSKSSPATSTDGASA